MKHTHSFIFLIFIPITLFCQKNISADIHDFHDSQNLLLSTIKIEVFVPNKDDRSKIDTASGTGFIFSFELDSTKTLPIIVTNKHVINDAIGFSLSMTKKSAANTPLLGQIDKFEFSSKNVKWLFHPDPSVDLAIIPLIPILDKFPLGRNGYAFNPILEDDIPLQIELEELKGVEEILMIGYPIGIWDYANNLPITRKGITATHPLFDYQNRSEFVIDAACFPGSSGSPVLIVNEGSYTTLSSLRMGKRRLFLGILYGGPNYQPNGEIKIIEIPTRKDAIAVFQVPLNLGYVIKSNKVFDFKPMLGLK